MSTPFPRPTRVALLAAAGLLAAACSDQTVTTPRSMHPAQRDGGAAQPSPFHANSEKYSDKGSKPWTGRSGSAVVTSRALLGKDGTTLIEATTGQLDVTATPPGNIAKTQLKSINANGDAITTQNFNGLTGGGYWSYAAQQLTRGAPLQVQTNVRGIDANRTDVVTTEDTVKLRPDLTVKSLSNPAHAIINTNVVISAVVSELNGDVGAKGDCVLYVDGQQVDKAVGIWVDAGSTVSCAFSTSFNTQGTKALKVAVENVTPGDWDTSNNAASGSIVIDVNMNWYASAYSNWWNNNSSGYNSAYSCYGYWYYAGCNGSDDNWSNGNYGAGSGFNVYAASGQASAQFPVNIDFGATTSGSTVGQVSTTQSSPAPGNNCVNAFDGNTSTSATVCSYPGFTVATAQRGAGYATYYSSDYGANWGWYYYCYWYCDYYSWYSPYGWSYNNTYPSGQGPLFSLGNDFTFHLNVTDATGGTFLAGGTLGTHTQGGSWSTGWHCSYYSYWYNYTSCSQTSSQWSDTWAWGTGTGITN